MDHPRVSTKQQHWKTLVRSFKSVFMNGSAEKNTEFGRLTVKRPSHKSEAKLSIYQLSSIEEWHAFS
jgi:hypothetical protein